MNVIYHSLWNCHPWKSFFFFFSPLDSAFGVMGEVDNFFEGSHEEYEVSEVVQDSCSFDLDRYRSTTQLWLNPLTFMAEFLKLINHRTLWIFEQQEIVNHRTESNEESMKLSGIIGKGRRTLKIAQHGVRFFNLIKSPNEIVRLWIRLSANHLLVD